MAEEQPNRDVDVAMDDANQGNGDSRGRDEENIGLTLFVSAISPKCSEHELKDMFAEYGNLVRSKILFDPQTRSHRGFGFVAFEKKEDAEAAMAALDGKDLYGRPLSVAIAKRNRSRTPTGTGNYLGRKPARYDRDRYRRSPDRRGYRDDRRDRSPRGYRDRSPRGYRRDRSPRRDYRDRSPPRRDYRDRSPRRDRSPPRRDRS